MQFPGDLQRTLGAKMVAMAAKEEVSINENSCGHKTTLNGTPLGSACSAIKREGVLPGAVNYTNPVHVQWDSEQIRCLAKPAGKLIQPTTEKFILDFGCYSYTFFTGWRTNFSKYCRTACRSN